MFSRRVKLLVIALLLPTLVVNNVYPALARAKREAAAARKRRRANRRARARAAAQRAAEVKAAAEQAAEKAAEKVKAAAEAVAEKAAEKKAELQESQTRIKQNIASRPAIDWAKATFDDLKAWVTFSDEYTLDLGFPDQRALPPITNKEEFEKAARDKAKEQNTELKDIGILYLEQNELTELPDNFFEIVPNVAEIYLSNNQIKHISDRAFMGTISKLPLYYLDLTGNEIEDLSPDVFEGQDDLYQVILGNNPIADFDNKEGSEQIDALNAEHPGVFRKRSVDSKMRQAVRAGTAGVAKIATQGVFSGDLRQRIKAMLKGKAGYTITAKAQEPFVNLARRLAGILCKKSEDLAESRPQLSNLFQKAANRFAAFRPVEEVVLNLANEDMLSMDNLNEVAESLNYDPDNFSKITMLRLSGNHLKTLPDNFLGSTFPNLKALDLSDNKLTAIRPDTFKGLNKLQFLTLANNRPLSSFPPEALPNSEKLRFVSLGNTGLSRGPKGDIRALRDASNAMIIKNPMTKKIIFAYTMTAGFLALLVLAIFAAPATGFWAVAAAVIGPASLVVDIFTEWAMGIFGQPAFIDKLAETMQEVIAERQEAQGGLMRGGGERKVKGLFRAAKAKTFEKLGWDVGQERILDLSNELLTSLDQITTKAEELYYDPAAFKDVTIVRLPRNNITTIPTDAFAAFPKVKAIDLGGNLIKTIEPGAFKNLGDLQFLLLGDNQITTFPANAVNGCTSLKLVTLGKNPIAAGYNLRERFENDKKLQNTLSIKEEGEIFFKTKKDTFKEKKEEIQKNRQDRKAARKEKEITECPVPDPEPDPAIVEAANKEADAEAEGQEQAPRLDMEDAPVDPEGDIVAEDIATEAEQMPPEQAEQELDESTADTPVAEPEEQDAVAVEFERVNAYAEIVRTLKDKVMQQSGGRVLTYGLDRQRLAAAVKLYGAAVGALVLVLGAWKFGLLKKLKPGKAADDLADDAVRVGGKATTAPKVAPTPEARKLVKMAPDDLQKLPADDIAKALSPDDAPQVLGKLSVNKRTDTMKLLPDKTLDNLPNEDLVKLMNDLPPDDFATIRGKLSKEKFAQLTPEPKPKVAPGPTPIDQVPAEELTVKQIQGLTDSQLQQLDLTKLSTEQIDALDASKLSQSQIDDLADVNADAAASIASKRETVVIETPEATPEVPTEVVPPSEPQIPTTGLKETTIEQPRGLSDANWAQLAEAEKEQFVRLNAKFKGIKTGDELFDEIPKQLAELEKIDDWAKLSSQQQENLLALVIDNPNNKDEVIFSYLRTISPEIQGQAFRYDELLTGKTLTLKNLEALINNDPVLLATIPSKNIKSIKPSTLKALPAEHIDEFLPSHIAALSKEQVGSLTKEQLDTLTKLQLQSLDLKNLKPDQLNALSRTQMENLNLRNLSTEQITALSDTQASYLTQSQIDELASVSPKNKEIIDLKRQQLKPKRKTTLVPKEEPSLPEPRLAQLTDDQITSARNFVGAERWDALTPSEQYYVAQLNIQGKTDEINSFLIAEASTRKTIMKEQPITIQATAKMVDPEIQRKSNFVEITDPETGTKTLVPRERTVTPELPPVKEAPQITMPEGLTPDQQAFFRGLTPEERINFSKLSKADIDRITKLAPIDEKTAKRELFGRSLSEGSPEREAFDYMDNFAQRYFDQLPTQEEKMIFLRLHGTTDEGMNKARAFARDLGIQIPEEGTVLKSVDERAAIIDTLYEQPSLELPKAPELDKIVLTEGDRGKLSNLSDEQREYFNLLDPEDQRKMLDDAFDGEDLAGFINRRRPQKRYSVEELRDMDIPENLIDVYRGLPEGDQVSLAAFGDDPEYIKSILRSKALEQEAIKIKGLPDDVVDAITKSAIDEEKLLHRRRLLDDQLKNGIITQEEYALKVQQWKKYVDDMQNYYTGLADEYPQAGPLLEKYGLARPKPIEGIPLSQITPATMTDDVIQKRLALASLDEWKNLTPTKRNEFANTLLTPDELKTYAKFTEQVDQLNYLKLNANEKSIYLKLMNDPRPSKKSFYANSSPDERTYFANLSSNKVPSLDEQITYMNLPRSLRTEMAKGATPDLTPTLARDLNIKTVDEWNTVKIDWNKLTPEQQASIRKMKPTETQQAIKSASRKTQVLTPEEIGQLPPELPPRPDIYKPEGVSESVAARLDIKNADDWAQIEDSWKALTQDQQTKIILDETLDTPLARRAAIKDEAYKNVGGLLDELPDEARKLGTVEELDFLKKNVDSLAPEEQVVANQRIAWLQEIADVSNKSDWDSLKTTLRQKFPDKNIDDQLARLERYLQLEQWPDLPASKRSAEWDNLTPAQKAELWDSFTPEEKTEALFQAQLRNTGTVPATPAITRKLPDLPQTPAPKPKTGKKPIIPILFPEEKEEPTTTITTPTVLPPEPPPEPPEPPQPPQPPKPPAPPKAPPAPEPRKRGYARRRAARRGLI